MELRAYSCLTVKVGKDKGEIEIPDAPVMEGEHPKHGVHFYHNDSQGLVNVIMPKMLEAMKNKMVLPTVEIVISELKRQQTGYAANSPMYMKSEDVPFSECLMLHLISSPLRSELIDVISARITDEAFKKELSDITADRYFLNFIRNNPNAVDYIHEHERFSHLKAIVYPVMSKSSNTKMCALYNIDKEQVSIRLLHPIEGITPVLPAKALSDKVEISVTNEQAFKLQK